jgi:hypothetical protein
LEKDFEIPEIEIEETSLAGSFKNLNEASGPPRSHRIAKISRSERLRDAGTSGKPVT